MKKQNVINNIKWVIVSLLIFLFAYMLQINLSVPLFLLSLILYFKFSFPRVNQKSYTLLNLTLLFVLILAISFFIIRQGWSVFLIPFCLVPMLATMLFNELAVSLLITLACAITISSLAPGNFYLFLLFLTNGVISIILLREVRQRNAISKAGLVIGLSQAVTLFFLRGFNLDNFNPYLILIANGIASSIIAAGLLPIFEYLFNTTTNISLLEMTDFRNPILQRMMIEAPGTYHHSLVVGNLSEAASQVVCAHALLARAGAYYHDIGKIFKPEYFSENQDITGSKHDNLSATISKMVIMNHVKEGVELAKKQRLNWRLIDFIQQHHGTSLVYYFYRRALENLENEQEVEEEGFRYPGPKPNTRETAIVLLADSVEAATRALKEPGHANIEELVHKVINNKFIDGQLDQCDLTLKDLEKISAVFIRILSGIYHNRVTYPEGPK